MAAITGTTMACACACDNWSSKPEMSACAEGGAVFLLGFSLDNCGTSLQHLPLHLGTCAAASSSAQQGIGAALCLPSVEQMRVVLAPRAAIGQAHESEGKVSAHNANKAIRINGRRHHWLIKTREIGSPQKRRAAQNAVPSNTVAAYSQRGKSKRLLQAKRRAEIGRLLANSGADTKRKHA